MRIPSVVAFLALSLAACVGTIEGDAPGDDDDVPATCGNGVPNSGETCDDGNTASGDGCSASCQMESVPDPRITGSVDKPSISTENGKAETVTATVTSVEGFAGTVNIAASLVDGTGAPITQGVTLNGPTSVSLAANGVSPAAYTIQFASSFTGTDKTATLKLDLTSPENTVNLTSSIMVAAVYTMTTPAGTGGNIGMHPATNKSITVKAGTKIRFTNGDNTVHITHGGGAFPHENTNEAVNGQPGQTYEVSTAGLQSGDGGSLGCHTHGDATYGDFRVE